VARQNRVDEVVVVSNAVAWETFQEIMQRLSVSPEQAPFEIKLSPGFYEILTTGVQVTQLAYVPLLLVNRERITGADKVLKNGLDYGLALINLIVAAPLMGLLALALRVSNRGPLIERHRVLACGGGEFTTWKFHTGLGETPRPWFAHPLALASGGQVAAAAVEQASGLQRFLYNTGLDKMPQLLNILRGEMSWVGPRTVSLGQVEIHSPWLPNLLTVKPGITGPWAVGGERTLDDEMRLTMVYIRNWTIWLDLQVLLQTALRVLRLERGKARLPER
jgi:lipopolysaccharide/colanic/teichoic acid biosynthesis glycosyltransferase